MTVAREKRYRHWWGTSRWAAAIRHRKEGQAPGTEPARNAPACPVERVLRVGQPGVGRTFERRVMVREVTAAESQAIVQDNLRLFRLVGSAVQVLPLSTSKPIQIPKEVIVSAAEVLLAAAPYAPGGRGAQVAARVAGIFPDRTAALFNLAAAERATAAIHPSRPFTKGADENAAVAAIRGRERTIWPTRPSLTSCGRSSVTMRLNAPAGAEGTNAPISSVLSRDG